MIKQFLYEVDNIAYQVNVTYRRTSRIHYVFKEGTFRISCPYLTSKTTIIKGLDKFAKRLVDTYNSSIGYGKDYIYLFGTKVDTTNREYIAFSSGDKVPFNNAEDFLVKVRPTYLNIINERVRHYEGVMNTKKHLVKVRKMTTRLGTNSKRTNTLTFSMYLIHFPMEVIDSVIIHELAHDYYFDHSNKFYEVVYKYCPEYKKLRKKIIKGDFAND